MEHSTPVSDDSSSPVTDGRNDGADRRDGDGPTELELEQRHVDRAYVALDRARERAFGLRSMVEVGRGGTNQARVENRDALTPLLESALADWMSADLLQALETAKVPAGPINSIGQALNDPQIAHRKMQISPEGIKGVRGPWIFSDAKLCTDTTAPTLKRN